MKRDIAVSIILSILTCGIYAIYWFICITDEVNRVAGTNDDTSGGMAFLFTLLTCGIYGIYWSYKMAEKINDVKLMRGMHTDSNIGILYLVLYVFGFSIVTYALLQNDLNNIYDAA